jgi:uncharacterized metal-binding protein YceD (DUF177 family)
MPLLIVPGFPYLKIEIHWCISVDIFLFFKGKTYLCIRFLLNDAGPGKRAGTVKKPTDMDPLINFSIPLRGLHEGIHQFDFQIDRAFFDAFENAPIGESQIQLNVELNKRPGLLTIHFDFEGTVDTECDRCLAPISLPIEGEQQLIAKISEVVENEVVQDEDDPDVIFIHPELPKLNLAPFVYEYLCLALPMIKIYDCDSDSPRPCNDEMLDRLGAAEDLTEEEPTTNPVWDELKKLGNNN